MGGGYDARCEWLTERAELVPLKPIRSVFYCVVAHDTSYLYLYSYTPHPLHHLIGRERLSVFQLYLLSYFYQHISYGSNKIVLR